MLKLLSPVHARLSVCLFQARLLEDEQKALHQQLQGLIVSTRTFLRVSGLHLPLKDQLRLNNTSKQKTPLLPEESHPGVEEINIFLFI